MSTENKPVVPLELMSLERAREILAEAQKKQIVWRLDPDDHRQPGTTGKATCYLDGNFEVQELLAVAVVLHSYSHEPVFKDIDDFFEWLDTKTNKKGNKSS
jgi:hypothetical protein